MSTSSGLDFSEGIRYTNPMKISNSIIETVIREQLQKPSGELTEEDMEKVTTLDLRVNQLTDVKGLENLTQLTELALSANELTDAKGLENLTQLKTLDFASNQLTDVKGLEKLTQLTELNLDNNPDLTKAQIEELQKALPKCEIINDYEY